MDLEYLQRQLKETLEQVHLEDNIRYCNVGFSSKNLEDLDDITQSLRVLLPNYVVWREPGIQGVPSSHVFRKQLQEKIFKSEHQGIIIHQPEQWLCEWLLLDKQAFWSKLSMSHGATKVVLSFAESDEFQQINNKYFKLSPSPLAGLLINTWIPNRADQFDKEKQ